jgi:hypothetical protein
MKQRRSGVRLFAERNESHPRQFRNASASTRKKSAPRVAKAAGVSAISQRHGYPEANGIAFACSTRPHWENDMTLQEMRKSYDPDEVTRALARTFAKEPPTGFIVGRSAVRNAVMHLLGCSQLEGEEIVDTLILRGRLMFVRRPDDIGAWTFRIPEPN